MQRLSLRPFLDLFLVAQVYLYSRNVIADPAQGSLDCATDLSGQRLATFDIMVRIDLYLHHVLLV